jgi:hypothetical protein
MRPEVRPDDAGRTAPGMSAKDQSNPDDPRRLAVPPAQSAGRNAPKGGIDEAYRR